MLLLTTVLKAHAFTPLAVEDLHEGDLLFACTDSANAITAVTTGTDGLPIDHVGILHRIGGDHGVPCVIEAVYAGVCITPLDTFVCRNPHVVVGRVNVAFDVKASVRRALHYVGTAYDHYYLPGDSTLYCSELVQLCYTDMQGSLVFAPIAMSFHDASGQVTPYWTHFYHSRGLEVPEGEPGTNPGEMSRREQVSIIGAL